MIKILPTKKKLTRWQKEQKERKGKKGRRFFWLWLILAGLLVLGGIFFKLIKIFRESVWDGENRINFVLAGTEAILVTFAPRQENLVLIYIPGQTRIELVRGYGKYRVEAVTQLENLEEKKGLLAESLQENFAVPVEGWMKISNFKFQISNLKAELLAELGNKILGREGTNFSRWDLVRLWWKIKGLRADQVEVVDLAKLGVLEERILPDGTTVLELNKNLLEAKTKKFFSEAKIREESFSLEVLNATLHPGLAEKAARLLTNIGGEVIGVGNSEVRSAKCEVKSEKRKKNSFTVKRIRKIFNCDWREKEEEKTEVTLILGEDYWQKLNQK